MEKFMIIFWASLLGNAIGNFLWNYCDEKIAEGGGGNSAWTISNITNDSDN